MKPDDVLAQLRAVAENLAAFIDKHDVVVPEVSVTVGMVQVTVTAKRIAPHPKH